MFSAFISLYGNLFISQLGESEKMQRLTESMWAEALDGVTMEQIDAALKKIQSGVTGFNEMPPKMGQFALLCKEKKQATVPFFVGLPAPRADKEKALKHLRDLKRMVRC